MYPATRDYVLSRFQKSVLQRSVFVVNIANVNAAVVLPPHQVQGPPWIRLASFPLCLTQLTPQGLKGMASADIGPPKPLEKHTSSPQNGSIEKLTDSVEKVSLHTDDSKPTSTDKKDESPPRPLHVYRRPQILLLSKSPLVKQPDGMPPLKDWFGCAFILIQSLAYPFTFTQGLERTTVPQQEGPRTNHYSFKYEGKAVCTADISFPPNLSAFPYPGSGVTSTMAVSCCSAVCPFHNSHHASQNYLLDLLTARTPPSSRKWATSDTSPYEIPIATRTRMVTGSGNVT